MDQLNKNGTVPQIKVLLQTGTTNIDINKQGLLYMKFKRYLNNTLDRSSNILTELDLSFYDYTGYDLLGIIQQNKSNLFIQYGFDTEDGSRMSPVYKVTPTRYRAVQDNRGIVLGVGGFGLQLALNIDNAENFKEKSSIRDIILHLARRNGWYTGTEQRSTIDIAGTLPNAIVKPAGTRDFDFIQQTLLPIADRTTVVNNAGENTGTLIRGQTGFYQATLSEDGGSMRLDVFKQGEGSIDRKVWRYEYGTGTDSQIISMTNDINYDWIIDGLNMKIPKFDDDYLLSDSELKTKYQDELVSLEKKVRAIFEANMLEYPAELKEISLKITLVDPEDLEYKTPNEVIMEQLKNILNTLNTIELTVVGNPNIRATDYIDLRAVNRDGVGLIQQGLWRIIEITENIGISGYQTVLKLVREVNRDIMKRPINTKGIPNQTKNIAEVIAQ